MEILRNGLRNIEELQDIAFVDCLIAHLLTCRRELSANANSATGGVLFKKKDVYEELFATISYI